MRLTKGGKAWLGLTVYIISYDVYAAKTKNETLSTAFYNSIKHPVKRWPVIVLWGYVSAHLFRFIPEKLDPLRLPWGRYYKDKGILVIRWRKDR